jgi:hypothetical protein
MKMIFLFLSLSILFLSFSDFKKSELKDQIVIYAVPIKDYRQLPTNKDYLKEFADVKINVRGSHYVYSFLKEYNSQVMEECKSCKGIKDIRVYAEVYQENKLVLQFEIGAGGQCLKVKNKQYCISKDFFNFFSKYLPLLD